MNIGLIGCGNISSTYLRLAPQFQHLSVTKVADINESAAKVQAEQFDCTAVTIDALLADPGIDLVINLTVPQAHADVSTRILKAGKHVYSEKPFVLTLEEGEALQILAEQQGLCIGSAPDTFLGGAHQCARELIDDGDVGAIVGGSCHFMNRGMENWHPNPDFFYQPGAGPMLDMGPYYLTNLVQLIGPVKQLVSLTATPFLERTITSEPRHGERLKVTTPTTIHSLLEFHSGALITVSMSWDVCQHEHNCMELYGTDATLHIPDPNFFGGDIKVATKDEQRNIAVDHPFAVLNDEQDDGEWLANYRGAGLADMVVAIKEGRDHRCNNKLALHVIDIMTSALRSGESRQLNTLTTTCERPQALNSKAASELLKR